ncbi:NAD(P)-dependent alcohol dehydrogenase [Neolewinella xylanilytica]|nr:NAD(P)-dependent alcohol dehydrogenase [Neolewinella xylanilytica]
MAPNNTMRAAKRDAYGPPEAISVTRLPVPSPNRGELLVRIHATTVNRTDCANLTARPLVMHLVLGIRTPRQARIGTDFAGEVAAVGTGVTRYRVGDRICGFRDTGLGGQAEYLTIAEDGPVMSIPAGLSDAVAAASLEGAHYAFAFLQRANVQAGQRVLINGGTGAIGSALLQFTAACDAEITVTGPADAAGILYGMGARRVIDYTRQDFTQSAERYDCVFDAVGKSTFGRCRGLLSRTGVYISSEPGPYWQNVGYALLTPLGRGKRVRFPVPYGHEHSFPFIRRHLEAGTFVPLLDERSFTLDGVVEAYRYVLTGRKRGNVILRIGEKDRC